MSGRPAVEHILESDNRHHFQITDGVLPGRRWCARRKTGQGGRLALSLSRRSRCRKCCCCWWRRSCAAVRFLESAHSAGGDVEAAAYAVAIAPACASETGKGLVQEHNRLVEGREAIRADEDAAARAVAAADASATGAADGLVVDDTAGGDDQRPWLEMPPPSTAGLPLTEQLVSVDVPETLSGPPPLPAELMPVILVLAIVNALERT